MTPETITTTAECPECVGALALNQVELGEILACDDCGAELEVRLSDRENTSIVGDPTPSTTVITPNGDGVNDVFTLPFALFKLTREAPVYIEIFDLSGAPVRRGLTHSSSGRFVRVWDGTRPSGDLVEPGVYIYRIRVDADARTVEHFGVVHVVY